MMKPNHRFFEQLKYVLPNIFTKKTVRVLALCTDCLEHDNDVPLESVVTELARETRKVHTASGYPLLRERYHYHHEIGCPQGHKVYSREYWTRWENVPPVAPFPG
jgi:hypothetical protein